eukprot:scaffold110628_cov30-Tisochrysis_lutea.AAC.3
MCNAGGRRRASRNIGLGWVGLYCEPSPRRPSMSASKVNAIRSKACRAFAVRSPESRSSRPGASLGWADPALVGGTAPDVVGTIRYDPGTSSSSRFRSRDTEVPTEPTRASEPSPALRRTATPTSTFGSFGVELKERVAWSIGS